MQLRTTRLLSAALIVVVGLIALRRAAESEVPVAPGSWDPVE